MGLILTPNSGNGYLRSPHHLNYMTSKFLPVEEARHELEKQLGMKGWSRTNIKRMIRENRPFIWREGRHFLSLGGLRSINVERVVEDIINARRR